MATPVTPYRLDPDQVLRAATALLRKIEKSQEKIQADSATKKPSLFDADGSDEEANKDRTPIWLVFTAKNHVVDGNRLKPGKIRVPHPLLTDAESRICLITPDPPSGKPDAYKELVASPDFPAELKTRIVKITSIARLKSKCKSFESKRQLVAEYDLFLADERIITGLPMVLGKVFYKSTTKRPIPVSLTGRNNFGGQNRPEKGKLQAKKRQDQKEGGSDNIGAPADVAAEIEKTLQTTLVHLAPAATTSVKAALTGWDPKDVKENIEVIVEQMVEKYIPKKWRGVRSIHIKTPTSIALPIWLADELWTDQEQVLDTAETPALPSGKKDKKRKAIEEIKDVSAPLAKKEKLIASSGKQAVKV